MTHRTISWSALLLVGLVGCGGADAGRMELTGRVTYKGQPVVAGTIHFDPDTSKGASGVQGTAQIVEGQYKTLRRMGPAAGPHILRVTGYDHPPKPLEPPSFNEVRIPLDIPEGTKTLDLTVPEQPMK